MSKEITLSGRFDLLLEHAKRSGKDTSYTAISKGTGISNANIRKIHTGDNQNPGLEVIDALANYFEVDPGYFFMKTETECLDYLKEKDNRRLLARARDLDEEALETLRELIDHIERDAQRRSSK
ncbi:MAG: helix-turn-helix domain-containing protein [Anaerolineales bacterium]